MFGRYPNRRLTLKDVLLVRLQRALLLLPMFLTLEFAGVLPALRDVVRTRGPGLVWQLNALPTGSEAPVASDPGRSCVRAVEGTAIVFQRPGAC